MRCSEVLLALAACIAVATAGTIHVTNQANDQFAHPDTAAKQSAILHLLDHVHQSTFYAEVAEVARKWDMAAHADHWANPAAVNHWMDRWTQGTLPKGNIFHVHNDVHLDEAVALFDVFYFANDFDTFYNTAAWAREHVNEGQFVYAFCVAVIHRPDCQGLELPPLYEVYPHFYLSSTDVQTFVQAKMSGHENYVAKANFSGVYDTTNQEQSLSYFTEDIGLNAYHAYAHMYNPFWMKPEKYGFAPQPHRGEHFHYFYQQILAHYNLNRMSANLAEHEDFDWEEHVVKPGYHSEVQYHSGHYFPARPDNAEISSIKSYSIADVKAIEYRIKDAIDSGYVKSKDGSMVSINHHIHGINILGNIIEGNKDSANSKYYGSYYSMLRNLFAMIMDPQDKHGVAPGPMAHFETAFQDPAFYVFIKHINDFFVQYKSKMPSYKKSDLYFNGVAVKDVQVDDLVTYFDYFDFDVTNAVQAAHHEEASKINFVAKMPRLNHQPFSVKVKVASDKKTNAVVRFFLGPKAEAIHHNFFGDSNVDYFGHDTYDIDQLRHYFVELDRFPVKMNQGENEIVRKSQDFTSTAGDHTSFKQLLHQAEQGTWSVSQFDDSCGFPDRLALPMGHVNGMPYTMYVVVTPYGQEFEDANEHSYGQDWTDAPAHVHPAAPAQSYFSDDEHQSVHFNPNHHHCNGFFNMYDGHSQGFPFDRKIQSFNQFYTPNMYFKDVYIFHNNNSEASVHQGPQRVHHQSENEHHQAEYAHHQPEYAHHQPEYAHHQPEFMQQQPEYAHHQPEFMQQQLHGYHW